MRSSRRSPGGPIPRPRKSLGQNFLVDPRVASRIVSAAGPLASGTVVEIGPGRGALTDLLLRETRAVAAVEVDRVLAAMLRERFGSEKLVLIESDILKLDWSSVAPALGAAPETRLVVVGNLPYNISKPLAMKLVKERGRIDRAVLTLQREVVDRLVARPGTKAYGAMGILVGQVFDVERLFDIPPGAFRPRPKVVSSVTLWRSRSPGALGAELEPALRACLAASFSHRRRTIFNNLRASLPGADRAALELLARAELDASVRPEAIDPDGYLRLARLWPRDALL